MDVVFGDDYDDEEDEDWNPADDYDIGLVTKDPDPALVNVVDSFANPALVAVIIMFWL